VISPNSSLSDAFLLSPETDIEDGLNCKDPSDFDWISNEDSDQGYVEVEFAAPTPPSVPKVEAYASKESPMSVIAGLLKWFSLCLLWKESIETLIWELNMMIVASLIDHAIGLSCTLIVYYGIIS